MTSTRHPSSSSTRILGMRTAVAAASVAAALLVWAVSVPLLGVSVTVPDAPGSSERTELAVSSVLGAALVASLAGWASLAVLERFSRRARTAWTVIALAVLLLTMPYMPGFTTAERVSLATIHLAVAAVLIPGLRATSARAGR